MAMTSDSKTSLTRSSRWRFRVQRTLGGEGRSRWGILLLTIAAAVLLTALGWGAWYAVHKTLLSDLAAELETILAADVKALEIWIENQRETISTWSRSPEVRGAILKLAERARKAQDPAEALVGAPEAADLNRQLAASATQGDRRGFFVVGRTGVILASQKEDWAVGRGLSPHGFQHLSPVLAGQVVMTLIGPQDRILEGDGLPTREALILSAAPIPDDKGRVAAALVFKIDPDQDFSQILHVAQKGESGETYAFDTDGFMLSQSRFPEQLQEIGLLEEGSDATALVLQVRDPGVDLTKKPKPETPVASWPLTRMAANAVSGRDGVDIEGYRDYRGVEVVGAWRWLEKYKFGVATELDAAEAFAVLVPVQWTFRVLFGLLVVAAGIVLFTTYRVQVLQDQIEDVEKLGQYTLLKKLGEGGMGAVYLARHAMLRRKTAIKMIRKDAVTPETLARFEREVRMTSELTHPNTVEIYDYGRTPEGVFYYAMEFLPGLDLAQLIDLEGVIPQARVIYILKQVCGSLAEAHGIGLVHRDIKPLNIFLTHRGGVYDFVKVLDFGLVKDVSEEEDTQMTAANAVTGTPVYIAPEIIRNPRSVETRSDLYSLGATAYSMLTGRDVFKGGSGMEILSKALNEEPRRPSEVTPNKIHPTLDLLILDCLQKNPDDRPASATAVLEILEEIEDAGDWDQKEARSWWGAQLDSMPDLDDMESSFDETFVGDVGDEGPGADAADDDTMIVSVDN